MTRDDVKAAGLNGRLLAKLTGRSEGQVSRWLNGHEETPDYVDTIVFSYALMSTAERQQLLARRTKRIPAMMTATICRDTGCGLDQIAGPFDIETDDDFGGVEIRAMEMAAAGAECCIKWQRPSDGQVAYWGPQGACFEPHWYGR